ncbi:hypothetical protein P8452_69488 [Trifolium repens]|nr:hypothetical protein P8452_69488 [Trifolium repens]
MIILLSQYLVSAQIKYSAIKPCIRDRDCPLCIAPRKRRCRKGVRFSEMVKKVRLRWKMKKVRFSMSPLSLLISSGPKIFEIPDLKPSTMKMNF